MFSARSSYLAMCILALGWNLSKQQQPGSSSIASCNYHLDVVFALDLSNSINRRDFPDIKEAMTNLIQSLHVTEDDIHVGLVTYSSTVSQVDLTGDKNGILNAIRNTAFLDGSTKTHEAINVATRQFERLARGGNVQKLLIIITDGMSDQPSVTLAAANNAKQAGISIYTVGVSSRVNDQELTLIASSRSQVFRSENFQDLRGDLVKATSEACTSIVTPPCTHGRFDLTFVLDTSTMQNQQQYFQQVKQFVKNVLVFPDIDSGNVRVSVVTYSNNGYIHFPLNRYNTKQAVLHAIDGIPYTPGYSNPSSMLQGLKMTVFTEGNGDRPNAPNVVVMVTSSPSEFNRQKTIEEANKARIAGIYIYGVGIGTEGANELNGIVSSPVSYNVLFAKDFYSLDSVVPSLVSKMHDRFCPKPPTVAPPACYDALDFVIAIDGSSTVTGFDFQIHKQAVANLVEKLRVSPDYVNIGLVLFSESVMTFPLSANTQEIINNVHNLQYFGHQTRTDLAINEAINLFRRGRSGNIKRLLMIITDGRPTSPSLTLQAARNAKNSGVNIYTVGLTDKVDQGELQALASSPSQVTVTTAQDLQNDLLRATNQACSYVPPTVILPPAPQQCFQQLDFVIAMDSSNSISPENFIIEKNAVIDLVRNLRVSPQDINVGFVEFSNRAQSFALTGDQQGVINYINNCKFMDDSTNTHEAIDTATNLFYNARGGNVRKILLIVTDGRATDRNQAVQSAQRAKAQGISVFVVGVTNAVNQDELLAYASSPAQVFFSNNFQGLRNELLKAAVQACKSAPPPVPTECLRTLDFVIAIDASNSIGPNNFEIQRRAIANLVDNLQISPQTRRVGLVLYSTQAVPYPLSGDRDQVIYNIGQMKYLNDLTRTYLAINQAYQMFLNDPRDNVRRILIIVTDGRANDPVKAQEAARVVKDAGITIYSVGVTNNVNRQELGSYASSPSQVLMSNNFQTLQNDLIRAASEACDYAPPAIPTIPTEPPTLPPECFQQLDFVLVVDSSDSIERSDFSRQRNAISNLVRNLQVTNNGIHVGLVLFSDRVIPYQLTGNQGQIINVINNFEHIDSSTMTHLAIDAANNLFRTSGRNGVRQILIVITDGRATDHFAALESANRVKQAGISIYAVGVGNNLDNNELQDLASSPQNVLHSSNFQTLQNDLIRAASQACRYVPAPKPPTHPPVIPTFPPTLPSQCFDQLDFVMAIDSSNSIGGFFETQRQAIGNLVRQIGVSPNGINVGIVLFSTTVKSYQLSGNHLQVLNDVRSLEHLDDQTMTGLAINAAIEVFQRARHGNVKKILMIVTDGGASDHARALEAARRAKNAGITIYAVGVTNQIDQKELQALASSPNMVFHSNDFLSLQSTLIQATTQACVTGPSLIDRGLASRLCHKSGHVNGAVGHVSHPTDCDSYIQCYNDPHTDLELAVVRHCPHGLFWDGRVRKCVPSASAHCQQDLCRQQGVTSYPMAGTSMGYWLCDQRAGTTGHCCPASHTYVIGQGCVYNSHSKDTCNIAHEEQDVACVRQPNWRLPSSYELEVGINHEWCARPCPSNNFDIADCKCSAPRTDDCKPDYSTIFGKTTWDNNIVNHGTAWSSAGAVLKANSWIYFAQQSKNIKDPITFTISYRLGRPVGERGQVLVTSDRGCYPQAGHLLITINKMTLQVQIMSVDKKMATISLPLEMNSAREQQELTFAYDQRVMAVRLSLGKIKIIEEIKAPVGVFFPCGFTIGRAQGTIPGFIGTLQDLSVYSCALSKLY